ncbi:MAG: hypothetical protein ACK44W_08125 [Planctomycetota bacterium]
MRTPKKVLLSLAFLAGFPLAVAADVGKEEIKKLVAAGVSDDVILAYIRAHGPVARLSADDVVELKQAGASERVLGALVNPAAAPTPVPAPERTVERVVERPVYVPQTTYVYVPGYSTVWCGTHYRYDTCVTYVTPYASTTYCYPTYRYSWYYPPSVGFSYYRLGRHWSWGVRYGGWCW